MHEVSRTTRSESAEEKRTSTGTSMPRITPLRWSSARDVLPHEAYDFTPWLAENLDLLAETLGLGAALRGVAELAAGPACDREPSRTSGSPAKTAVGGRNLRRTAVRRSVRGRATPTQLAPTARLYGATLATGRRARRRVTDLLIAAVAVSLGLPVITRNPADFAGLDAVVEVIAV